MANVVVVSRAELRQLEAEAARAGRLAEENQALRTDLKAALATIAAQETKLSGLVTLGENLQAQIAELKAKLGTNSGNSSNPPSSDGPGMRPGRGRTPSQRRRGGQPGHTGAQRALVSLEEVDEIIDGRRSEVMPTVAVADRDETA